MEQLHPNWCALATVQIPLKRFVREGVAVLEMAPYAKKHQVLSGSGDEIRDFYEATVSRSATCSSSIRQDSMLPAKNAVIASSAKFVNKISFDRNKFFRAAMENRVEILKDFDYGCGEELNVTDDFGWTALMMAACEGAANAVRVLIDMGADKNIRDKRGHTAIDLARKNGYHSIAKMLDKKELNEPIVVAALGLEEKMVPFYCELCKQTFSETTLRQHQTSTVHQFNAKSSLPPNKLVKFNITPKNRGLQLMVKQGWDAESGLGPEQCGRLYPIKTVIRKKRTGLGIEQPPARVTHFEAFDMRAIQRQNSDYYRKKPRNRNDIAREKKREWKRERRLRNALS